MKLPWKAPWMLKKYPATPNKKAFAQLERTVMNQYLTDKYNKLLSNYNVFYLYHLYHANADHQIDKRVIWGTHTESLNGKVLVLKSPLSKAIFRKCLDPKLASQEASHWKGNTHIGFQSISTLDQLLLDEKWTKFAYSDNVIKPYGVGIRLDGAQPIDGLNEIEPILEEAQDMYKNLGYEGLLAIAKRHKENSTTATSTNKTVARKFLESLANIRITNPIMTSNSKWLMFTDNNH
ncbi:similar to Saccharomyces cerevisiae YKL208W CBT1 Protein involved in 5' end processing of mitochondrial COB, 15S_rRNA, and RPM1 transcripts [Maudiozyma saulgeensis]|uniref:Similar to Saccharomyces cerevisiae YKL208W CBT1 Protein involved in 5' end processing of mitochondrial COB, 15S_rRNA, and RPM1 transcripts n=1 Tax=Maudiozyma saulgeensis TaxID=1789683 RepID=A0A1X7R1Q2_9SACH|nr:similar to Saccharomyces cerevisiae YKL208W CBT1 Protein involved in 5' end processing of mitochondrial COB, 15S_rRNA, and RPM1 transcripts [Kazachstania saulgeensis]